MDDAVILQIENRVHKIEKGHYELASSMESISKDMHVLSDTLVELKDVMKTLAMRETEFQLFRQEFQSHAKTEERTQNDLFNRVRLLESQEGLLARTIDSLVTQMNTVTENQKEMKTNINKGVWIVLGAFLLGAVNLLLKVPQ